jgi:hypothetical protein
MALTTSRMHFLCLALHYDALLSAFSVIMAGVLYLVISVIIKGATVSPHAPNEISRRTTRVHYTHSNPEPPANVFIFP